MEDNVTPPKLLILTTSYPRFAGDDAGIFVQRLVAALSQQGNSGTIVVPRDKDEPQSTQEGGFEVMRLSYSILGQGNLAFGARVS